MGMKASRITMAFLAVALTLPATLSAQSFGVAGRFGTLGLGVEAAIGLGRFLAIRGGLGVMPFDVNGTVSDIKYSVAPPHTIGNIGADLFFGGSGFRVSGGLLFKSHETALTGELLGNVEINGQTYAGSELGTLVGTIEHDETAPYATIGYGRLASRGVGFFMDLGAAFIGEPTFALDATGPIRTNAQFQANLEQERLDAEADMQKYLKVLPIVSFGLRVGLR
jgi:hypothetical protein